MVFKLPHELYVRFDQRSSQGQAALLHEMRGHPRKPHPATEIKRNGVIVEVNFETAHRVEVARVRARTRCPHHSQHLRHRPVG